VKRLCVGWEVDCREEESETLEDVAELKGGAGSCREEAVGDWLARRWWGRDWKTRFDEVD
jgi:hypothetical protein